MSGLLAARPAKTGTMSRPGVEPFSSVTRTFVGIGKRVSIVKMSIVFANTVGFRRLYASSGLQLPKRMDGWGFTTLSTVKMI